MSPMDNNIPAKSQWKTAKFLIWIIHILAPMISLLPSSFPLPLPVELMMELKTGETFQKKVHFMNFGICYKGLLLYKVLN